MMTWVSEISGNASMGVCRMAQRPTADNEKTNRKTMKRFLALKSMIRSTMDRQSLDFMPGMPPMPHHGLEPAFAVDQEIGRGDDVLTLLQSLQYLRPFSSLHARLDGPRFQLASAVMEKHHLLLARFDDGFLRNRESRAEVDPQLHVGIHIRLELLIRIVEFEPNFGGTGLRVEGRIDEAHLSGQHGARIIREGRRLPSVQSSRKGSSYS